MRASKLIDLQKISLSLCGSESVYGILSLYCLNNEKHKILRYIVFMCRSVKRVEVAKEEFYG